MLQEILLSLSGRPSPLLDPTKSTAATDATLTPPEQDLLRTAGHLSNLHFKLIEATKRMSATHPSVICRAVSTGISSVHLQAFQHKILEVEEGILRKDAGLVGAYNIVPLTAIVGEFSGWTRRLEWLWDLAQSMAKDVSNTPCRGAQLIERLRNELQTGYADIEQTALSLLRIAETTWLKQVAAWVLYGRLPTFGDDDFFIQRSQTDETGFRIDSSLLPNFVSSSTAASMLFIGVSINRVQTRSAEGPSSSQLSGPLQEISKLQSPLNTVTFARAMTAIRLHLSRTTLQKLLPLGRVSEILRLLREFFLLGRGEFAMALTQQADERIRSRWRRADNLAYEKRDGLAGVVVKEGEVAAVLSRTWAALGSMQGEHAEEDEELELARDLLRLNLSKSKAATPSKSKVEKDGSLSSLVSPTPFRNLLFSVPVVLSLNIPSPVDLFLTTSDLQVYTSINSYLLSIRRAHIRLTDLWKITSIRRHHPAPPRAPYSNTKGGINRTRILRERWASRNTIMRSAWATSSAAIFFLGETEAYLQVEVVEGLWDDFYSWLTHGQDSSKRPQKASSSQERQEPSSSRHTQSAVESVQPDTGSTPQSPRKSQHNDPQTLAIAHRLYLRNLVQHLLLTQVAFTDALYNLLIHIDHLVALTHRLQGVWTSIDLETDEGVVDAFSNLEAEEADVRSSIRAVGDKVKKGVEEVVGVLRTLSMDSAFIAELEDGSGAVEEAESLDLYADGEEETRYNPRRVGGVDRLLMKLDFGGWFDPASSGGAAEDDF